MKVVASAIKAGYKYAALGNANNPTQASSAPPDSQLGKTFATSDEAVIWATSVLGEYEINNKQEITQVGSGLHPQVEIEKKAIEVLFNKGKYDELGIGPQVVNKVKILSAKNQGSVYSNLIDDLAIAKTINKALITRRLLLSGAQAEESDQRDKKIAVLEREIKSLMFERRIKQELANNTMLELLKIQEPRGNQGRFKTPENSPFL